MKSATPSISPAPTAGSAVVSLSASLYYPSSPARNPANYTSTQIAHLLQALKCDYAALAGILGEHIAYLAADPDPNAAVAAPALAGMLRAAAASASSLTSAGCRDLMLAQPASRRRALQQAQVTVLAAAPFASVGIIFNVGGGDPIIGEVPVGSFVAPVVSARLAAARQAGTARFPISIAYWSAASSVSSWGTIAFFAPGVATVNGDAEGTLQQPAKYQPGLVIGLSIGISLAVIIGVAIIIYLFACGGAAVCPHFWRVTSASGRSTT